MKAWLAAHRPLAWAFVAGAATAIAGAGAFGLAVVELGAFNASASKPHEPLVYWSTHETMIRSVEQRAAGIAAPARFTAAQVQAGLATYQERCAMCHGGPATDRQPWVAGLNPTPPYLVDSARHWSKPQLYWIIKHGLKMTAMPAWQDVLSDQEVWNTVALLEAMPDLSPEAYLKMVQAADRRGVTPVDAQSLGADLSPATSAARARAQSTPASTAEAAVSPHI